MHDAILDIRLSSDEIFQDIKYVNTPALLKNCRDLVDKALEILYATVFPKFCRKFGFKIPPSERHSDYGDNNFSLEHFSVTAMIRSSPSFYSLIDTENLHEFSETDISKLNQGIINYNSKMQYNQTGGDEVFATKLNKKFQLETDKWFIQTGLEDIKDLLISEDKSSSEPL